MRITSTIALAAAVTATSAPAAVTFGQAFIFAQTYASSGNGGTQDQASQIETSFPATGMSGSASNSFTGSAGTVSSESTTSLAFDDTESGTVFFSWSGAANGNGTAYVLAQAYGAAEYRFTSDRAFRVTSSYEVSTTHDDLYGPQLGIALYEVNTPAALFRVEDIETSGLLATPVFAAGTYRLTFANDRILGLGGDTVLDQTESLNGSIGFRISAAGVPEPATWAMMVLGFGLTGAAARRRRSLATA